MPPLLPPGLPHFSMGRSAKLTASRQGSASGAEMRMVREPYEPDPGHAGEGRTQVHPAR